ncbi:hypothetical protein VNI00_019410 [Paramarasmius palmivorus]|uniref:Uncharacterized protein n=1 Tax=Paramarasmius palmivorus TaxID=297713 RepID=A0AAW0ALM1_9AGAR
MLQILYNGTDGQPRQDLIDTWAKLLRVRSTEATAWVRVEQEKSSRVEAEPGAGDDSLEELFGEDREDPQAFMKHLLISIHQEVTDSYTHDDSKPKNSEDFVHMFEPHRQAMQMFLANAERGSLESLGFSAGAIPA